jgi:hypothetical protein
MVNMFVSHMTLPIIDFNLRLCVHQVHPGRSWHLISHPIQSASHIAVIIHN